MPIHAYLTVKGSQQGDISKGCGIQEGHEDEILVYAFDHAIQLPTDRDTGQPSGRRQHTPFKITKKIDAASPLLYKALTKGEPVDAEIKLFQSDKGAEVHYYTIKLKKSIISNMHAFMPTTLDPKNREFEHMEEVSFAYEAIVWTHDVKGKEHEDGWKLVGKA